MTNRKKILIAYGTRPEAIKFAPLIHELNRNNDYFETKICSTAQHRDMLDQVHKLFDIIPDFDLNIMRQGQDLVDVTSDVLIGMKRVFNDYRPDIILVHGDTSTTLSCSLAAFYNKIDIGHIEAGLRTYNLQAPFPEEFNRQVVTKITKWHFAPTKLSYNNILKEGIDAQQIHLTGNTVIDSMYWMLNKIETNKHVFDRITNSFNNTFNFPILESKYILITVHRRENFGNGITEIINAIEELAVRYPLINFVYPVHKNPNIIKPVTNRLSNLNNVYLIEPQNYESFLILLKHCFFVLTDSGGLQEEAPGLKKPVLVLRDVTERPEAVLEGTAKLVGSDHKIIVDNCIKLIENKEYFNDMINKINPFGDGTASIKIVSFLKTLYF